MTTPETNPVTERGKFPFPMREGMAESRELVWVRNHANYLTGYGLKDYLRATASIVRGLIVNLLIGVPYVLAAAVGVVALNLTKWGLAASIALLVASLGWILLAPVALRVWQISRIRRSAVFGTDSSIESRDRFDHALGSLLLVTVLVAVGALLAQFLDTFHLWTQERSFGLREVASSGFVSLGVFTSLARMLPFLAGRKRTAVTVTVGVIGALAPLVAIMVVADWLVYSPPAADHVRLVLIIGAVLWGVLLLAFLVGVTQRAFGRRFVALSAVGLTITLIMLNVGFDANENVRTQQNELDFLLSNLDFVPDPEKLSTEQAAAVEALAQNIAERPPASLTDLLSFMKANRRERNSIFIDPEPPIPRGDEPRDGLDERSIATQMIYLYEFGGHLASVRQLIGEVGSSFDVSPEFYEFSDVLSQDAYPMLFKELELLYVELWYIAPIFEAFESTPDAPADMLFELLARYNEDLISELFPLGETFEWEAELAEALLDQGDGTITDDAVAQYLAEVNKSSPLAKRFPLIAKNFPDAFSRLHDDLYFLADAIRWVRIDVAHHAVFSAQYSQFRDDGAVQDIRMQVFNSSAVFALILAVLVWVYGWLMIDPNRTSLLSMYRDRLAYAFLVRSDPEAPDRVKPEIDVDLDQLSRYDLGSTAPYHLINCSLNLPASREIEIRDRQSDFFIFSKRFTGSVVTGYCRSEKMERVFPDMSVSTAMGISAAAASPNMGRSTSRMLAVVMVMLNLRLGYWVPNPRTLEEKVKPHHGEGDPRAFTLDEVLTVESDELMQRWKHLPNTAERMPLPNERPVFLAIAFSGGGIRSATLNLGITQALHEKGVFDQIDYMSTVSGGGYLGSSISVSMRSMQPVRSPLDGTVAIRPGSGEHAGKQIVSVTKEGRRPPPPDASGWQQIAWGQAVDPRHDFVYDGSLTLAVRQGQTVKVGSPLVRTDDVGHESTAATGAKEGWEGTFGQLFQWRTRPGSLVREFVGQVHERSRSVNVSDGGHIENLATFELLRRKCRYIIVGDGEMDPHHRFKSLTTLLRTARVELGVKIDINLDCLRLNKKGFTKSHWAIGRIDYGDDEPGYLLYLKSSMTGREAEDIRGYRAQRELFPHEPTSDQFFDEGQFESYRNLGYHIAREALRPLRPAVSDKPTFAEIGEWFEDLWNSRPAAALESSEF